MVTSREAYGIRITDDFGYFYDIFAELEELESLDISDYCTSCPSTDNYQYVLGNSVAIHKKMDFAKIHQEWLNYMNSLPQEIKDVLEKIKLKDSSELEPDIHIMVGEC